VSPSISACSCFPPRPCAIPRAAPGGANLTAPILPAWARGRHKPVAAGSTDWDTTASSCNTDNYTEFYRIDDKVPRKLDDSDFNLLAAERPLTPTEQEALQRLTFALDDFLGSNTPCSGDGNLDGVVNDADIEQLEYWQALTGFSSWYDFDLNGKTNAADLTYITRETLLRDCP
jgi:hypothetical protein